LQSIHIFSCLNFIKDVTGVNILLRVGVVKTSVDHRTLFEIAGKGTAWLSGDN
jgi:4-hydroxy-L-threonine phosphate dehydrogenase PdxA